MAQDKKQGKLTVHTENIFPIIKKWLYSEHDIFLRELIANAVDAMNKREAMDPDVKKDELQVEVKIYKRKKALEIIDNGIGMTQQEIKKYINQIAFSSAEGFVEKYKDRQGKLIGQFGLGFYSSFMVAKKVTIDSLSFKKGSEPAYWECEGSTDFQLDVGKRKEPGTTVTIYLNQENQDYLEDFKLKELIEKYCNFMPFPIVFDKKVINIQQALWHKKPRDIEESEYKEFYKELFHQYEDPLFWIHLNVDFPFKLEGILYFPKLNQMELDLSRGKIKLYCHDVFVADDLKGIVPEFLLLLRGGMDIPDIPLNVSRSFLQEDRQVKQISQYIIKKVADSLKDIFKDDRKRYEGLWEDITHFIKYGMLTEEKFYENMKEQLIFKTSKGDYVTIEEYLVRNPQEGKQKKIYYAPSEDLQVTYMNMMKEQGTEVIFAPTVLDGHLFQKIEMDRGDVSFVRIDSEINENIINKDKKELVDQDNKTASDKIKTVFEKAINNDKVTVEVKSLKMKDIPAMVVFNEHMRRFQEMSQFANPEGMDMLAQHTLVVNSENETVKKLLSLNDKGKTEEVNILCNYIHELGLIEQKPFTGKELQAFIEKSNKVLQMIE